MTTKNNMNAVEDYVSGTNQKDLAAGVLKQAAQDSGWHVSFWFAISSPLLGVLLGLLAAAIFCR